MNMSNYTIIMSYNHHCFKCMFRIISSQSHALKARASKRYAPSSLDIQLEV